MNRFPLLAPALPALLAAAVVLPAISQTISTGPSVLFVRGADRSGGFLEANNDAERTEQLADINNFSTSGGNHGWGELATLLRDNGFDVSQITETLEPGNTSGQSAGVAVPFDTLDLSVYDSIVLGSNNAAYSPAQVDAIETYVRGGGGVLFISDANFGSDWADASNSDQPFLDRFGLIAHQDRGTYNISRADGEFVVPDHPLFDGINQIDGEGVTPIRLADTAAAGVNDHPAGKRRRPDPAQRSALRRPQPGAQPRRGPRRRRYPRRRSRRGPHRRPLRPQHLLQPQRRRYQHQPLRQRRLRRQRLRVPHRPRARHPPAAHRRPPPARLPSPRVKSIAENPRPLNRQDAKDAKIGPGGKTRRSRHQIASLAKGPKATFDKLQRIRKTNRSARLPSAFLGDLGVLAVQIALIT